LRLTALSVHSRSFRANLLALLLPIVALSLFLLAPGTLDEKLSVALSGLSGQRLDHTIVIDGQPLAIEARMLGIYTGFAVATATAWLGGASRRGLLPRGPVGAVVTGGIVWMALDGLNAWIFGLGGPALYPPENDLRLWTGLLAGMGVAAYAYPAIGVALWKERDPRPLFATGPELLRAVIALSVAGLVIRSGVGGATVLSAFAALCVVAGGTLVNAYIATTAWLGTARAERWQDLRGLAAVGFVMAAMELAGLAALRAWGGQ
jgi:hypothetical protein